MKTTYRLTLLILLLSACGGRYKKATVLYDSAVRLEENHLPDSALTSYLQSLELLDKTDEYELMGNIHLKVGDILSEHSLQNEALQEYRAAYKYGSKLKDKSLLSRSLRSIGKYYLLKDSIGYGTELIMRPLKLLSTIEDSSEIAAIYNNVSYVYRLNKKYSEALAYNAMAIYYGKDLVKLYYDYSNRGKIYELSGDITNAVLYLNKASKSPNLYTQASAIKALSRIYKQIGDSVQYKKYEQMYFEKSYLIQVDRKTDEVYTVWKDFLSHKNQRLDKRAIIILLFVFLGVIAIIFLVRYFYHINNQKTEIAIATQRENKEDIENIFMKNKQSIASLSSFENTELYHKIKKLVQEEEKCCRNKSHIQTHFTYEEIELLSVSIRCIYKDLINEINQMASVALTSNEEVYCCLSSQLKLSTYCCAVCMNVSKESIRQYKMKIRKKMEKTLDAKVLFSELFPLEV